MRSVDLRVGSGEVASERAVTQRIDPELSRRPGHLSASVVHRVRIRRHPDRDEAGAPRDRAIVLCPDHLISKWRDELEETIPGVKVTTFDAAGKGCKHLITDMSRLHRRPSMARYFQSHTHKPRDLTPIVENPWLMGYRCRAQEARRARLRRNRMPPRNSKGLSPADADPSCQSTEYGRSRWRSASSPFAKAFQLCPCLSRVSGQGQRTLNRCSGKDFQHEPFAPTATAAFHNETRAVWMLLQE
jgi:hypothetical protein